MSSSMPARFPCPSCGSPLRLRERRFIGATFPCPECGTALTLLGLADGQATVQLAVATIEPHPSAPPTAVRGTPGDNITRWASPLVIGWAVALLVGGILILLVMAPDRSQVASSKDIVVTDDAKVSPAPLPPQEVATVSEQPEVVAPEEDPPAVEPEVAPVIPQIVFDPHAEPPVSALDVVAVAPTPVLPKRPGADAVLQQRLSRFEQPMPASRREMLTLLENLIGRRIEWEDDQLQNAVARLDEQMTLSLEDVTVGELITKIFAGTELQLAITDDGARLQRRGVGEDSIVLPAEAAP